ncbi:MAG: chemotaxis protein CheW [Aphanocapsa sp. GSE-SYN-MK-11-07L]|jgi:chemotaxis signal transduction protein|nr:chemotaxis protein CheW [Aphanocapsa sp. GSE-SYN-MK-11-07L]
MPLPNPQPQIAAPTANATGSSDKLNQTLQILTFKLGNDLVAVPTSFVIKVMNRPPDRQANPLDLLYIGQAAIRLLNLRSSSSETLEPILIILQIRPGEFHAIPVADPPNLLDLPVAHLQPLSPAQKSSDLLSITSHVARITEAEETSIVLVLDLNQILSAPLLSNLGAGAGE